MSAWRHTLKEGMASGLGRLPVGGRHGSLLRGLGGKRRMGLVMQMPYNNSLQPTVIPLRGLPAAELKR